MLGISDDSGFLALVVPASYKGFVAANWHLDQLFRHFVERMSERSMLIWGTGLAGMWRVGVQRKRSTASGFREVGGPILVIGGAVLVTNYESLTMAAQFEDVHLPERHQHDLLVNLPDGDYLCRVIQMFDPDMAESAGATGPDFVREFEPTVIVPDAWTEVPWHSAK